MPRYVILAQSINTANALGALLELLGERPFADDSPQRIIWEKGRIGGDEKGVLAYEGLALKIEEAAKDSSGTVPLNEVVVLVDSVAPTELNPLHYDIIGNWDSLLAMLILTFPEIRWFFGFIPENSPRIFSECHSLSALIVKPRRDPLLDATGLRNYVRKCGETKRNVILPCRKERAAAIDEESNYALFHAYTAYRFGYLAEPVRSWTLMDYLFGESAPSKHGIQLLLEDVNLNFPDKPQSIHLSTFSKKSDRQKTAQKNYPLKPDELGRADHCPRLTNNQNIENSDFRIIVTSGHSGDDNKRVSPNLTFIEQYKGPEKSGYVLKPVGGMFDLWTQAELLNRLPCQRGEDGRLLQQGHAPGFYWPPQVTDVADVSIEHSAPGKLMLIAQRLIRRADGLKNSANTVEECVRGAVLATDALEILRYQTPTLALQALCLKHEFEVKAEVAFLGVGNTFAPERRLVEIEREVHFASRFFEKKRRRAAELDTLVSIANRLMLIFREAGQFDEELICLSHIRLWHRKLQLQTLRNPLSFVFQLIMAYSEWLIAVPGRFLLMFFFWFLILLLAWIQFVYMPDQNFTASSAANAWYVPLVSSASTAWDTFVANNPNDATEPIKLLLNSIGSALGILHFGVFISYLYSVIVRK